MAIAQKTLIILRHAKAERGATSQDDHDRPLSARGMEEATAMGQYFARNNIKPDKILCSTSLRTRQTWEYMNLAMGVEYTEKLYHASANEMLNLIRPIPESIQSLMLIGHNPGLHELCVKLAKTGDEKGIQQIAMEFPPCSLARLTYNSAWATINDTRLVEFRSP